MRKLIPVIAGFLVAAGTQATVVGDLSATIDWDSLNSTGVTMTPTSFSINGRISSSTEDLIYSASLATAAPVILNSFDGTDAALSLGAIGDSLYLNTGYQSSEDRLLLETSFNQTGTENAASGALSAVYTSHFFQAGATGIANFSVDYDLSTSVNMTLNEFPGLETGAGTFFFGLTAFDVADTPPPPENIFNSDKVLQVPTFEISSHSSDGLTCEERSACSVSSLNTTGTHSLSFDVTEGMIYSVDMSGILITSVVFVEAPEGGVSEVPVPAAAWLFGSALLGLVGVGRRSKKS